MTMKFSCIVVFTKLRQFCIYGIFAPKGPNKQIILTEGKPFKNKIYKNTLSIIFKNYQLMYTRFRDF